MPPGPIALPVTNTSITQASFVTVVMLELIVSAPAVFTAAEVASGATGSMSSS
jgi:hypothetical protein